MKKHIVYLAAVVFLTPCVASADSMLESAVNNAQSAAGSRNLAEASALASKTMDGGTLIKGNTTAIPMDLAPSKTEAVKFSPACAPAIKAVPALATGGREYYQDGAREKGAGKSVISKICGSVLTVCRYIYWLPFLILAKIFVY
ncbi:MAG: hypothetical protein WCW52_10685 [Elusimicrobiales bacterium]|jgi:hypothetical protein